MRLALLSFVLLPGLAPQDDVKKVAPAATGVKKLAKKIAPDARARIEKALGEKVDDKDLAGPFYECYDVVPAISASEKTRCVVAFATAKGPKGAIRVGVVAATAENMIHLVRVVENADDKAVETRAFLAQFEGLEYNEESLQSPPSVLADALKKAAAPKDDAAKDLAALLRMSVLMRTMGPAWIRLEERVEKKDRAAAEDAAAFEKSFEEVSKIAKESKLVRATQQPKFLGHSDGARKDFAELKAFAAAGKWDEASRKFGEIDTARCAPCHGGQRRGFRTQREDQKLGNGHFSTKLDVGVPEPKLEASCQAAATAARKALLLAVEAK